ncbi:PTS glucitol/sorbitol transporter subunit IIA [Pectinatus sottacetonis]|uniref:PTS glucitol/sorbitol transporter subunit IIA n=1 Tax=Pectinatus sottacetonis TaxID=1002795 RepID=UPI0018C47467|nr:PTS glucitol/sorbitol transporter subunit IIA [Pectinatus sottacetonis]
MKYKFDVVSIGENVANFLSTSKCITIIDEGCSEGLAAMSVVHTKGKLESDISIGDTLEWGSSKFKIVEIGANVNKNLAELGHCTIVFNGKVNLPGQMAVEGVYLPHFRTGEVVKIY